MSLLFNLLAGAQTKNDSSKNEPLCFEVPYETSQVSTIQVLTQGDVQYPNLWYSTDGKNTWNEITSLTSITLSYGDKVYIKGDNPNGLSTSRTAYVYFGIPKVLICSGNIMSLLGETVKDIPNDYCFTYLFKECYIYTNFKLPALKLTKYCYANMFYSAYLYGNTLKLPATTLAEYCYNDMFYNCTTLVNAPALPATTLATGCYDSMFALCYKLVIAPELPATTLASNCYSSMFTYCRALINPPELPATELKSWCYSNMFRGCSSLEHAPILPAKTLNQIYCYYQMFSSCSKLNYIKADFLTEPFSSSCTENWVNEVASTGTFVKNIDATWDDVSPNGVPIGWDIEYNFTITSCTSLMILEANNVSSSATTTKVKYKAVVNGLDESGNQVTGKEIIGKGTSNVFAQNTSDQDITRTITFTYLGQTATATITQKGTASSSNYEVLLNNEWQLSSTVPNPDSSLYDGVYESFAHKGQNSTVDTMQIHIQGYTTFQFYIRSYAESNYDYVSVGVLDNDSFTYNQYSNTSVVKAHTRGNQKSGTTLADYTLVTFDNLDGGEHTITIKYGKDSSADSGDDRGYVLIPKNQ